MSDPFKVRNDSGLNPASDGPDERRQILMVHSLFPLPHTPRSNLATRHCPDAGRGEGTESAASYTSQLVRRGGRLAHSAVNDIGAYALSLGHVAPISAVRPF
jgi:hypothetical protein